MTICDPMLAFCVKVDLISRAIVSVLRGGIEGGKVSFFIRPISGSMAFSAYPCHKRPLLQHFLSHQNLVDPTVVLVASSQSENMTNVRFCPDSGVTCNARHTVGDPIPKSINKGSFTFRLVLMP